jgi:hypothetical protein
MQPQDEVGVTSKRKLWTGRLITVLTVAFLLFDAMVKVLNVPVAVQGTVRLGYPPRLVIFIGIVEFICLGAYLYPRTAVLGAILLTGYLGGAIATQVRVEDPWFIFPLWLVSWFGRVCFYDGAYSTPFPLQSLKPLLSCGSAPCCAFYCLSFSLLSPFGAVTGTPRSCATQIWST